MKNILITIIFFAFSAQTNLSLNEDYQEQKSIIVYGSDTCHYCLDTKAYLKERNIEYIYYDVDVNKEKEKEMIMKLRQAKIPLSSLSLPVIDKGGNVFTNDADFKAFLKRIVE